jgi:hypothetical protein
MELYGLSHFGTENNPQQFHMKVGIAMTLRPLCSEAERPSGAPAERAPSCAGREALQVQPILRGWSVFLPFGNGINIPRSINTDFVVVCVVPVVMRAPYKHTPAEPYCLEPRGGEMGLPG